MNPVEFAVGTLEQTPYEWQAEAMIAVAAGIPTSVVAANGSGKTDRLVAPLILWFLSEFPKGWLVFTSGSFRQLTNQLWPSIRAHRAKFPKWSFLSEEIRTPEGGFALGFSTNDAGRAEGYHGDLWPGRPETIAEWDLRFADKIAGRPDAPLFLIIDEAKTVPNAIFEAFDRCTRIFQLWTSSPGKPMGQFYDSHHKHSGMFHTVQVPSTSCPHIPAERIDRDRMKYGADHPLFRSKHLAEFTEDAERLILTAGSLQAAIDSQPPENINGEVVAFCDFAAGRDENVLAIRRGNQVRIAKAWVEKNTMQAAREFADLFRFHQLPAAAIWGDADGLGTAMIDALAELGWRINRFHGGAPSNERDEYNSLISEVWHVGAREIERGRINLGQLDHITFEQLTTRSSEWTDDGRLRIESKKKMAAEGRKSPDRADTVLGCIVCGHRMTGAVTAASLPKSTAPAPFAVPHVRF